MAKDPFDAALAGFRRWLTTKPGGDPEVAAGEMRPLLDLMRDYLGIDRPAVRPISVRATSKNCCCGCIRGR